LSLFLTLVVVPVVFHLVESVQERWIAARTPAQEAAQSA